MSDRPRMRLKNRTGDPVGIHAQFSGRSSFFFGLIFFGVGVWIGLIGLEVVEVDPSKVNAPMWVLTACGVIFALSGCLIWGMGLRQIRLLRNVEQLAKQYPGDPAMADYPWDRTGFTPPRWTPARKSWVAVLFFIVFALIPNWLSREIDSGFANVFMGFMAVMMNLTVLAVIVYAARLTWHAFKFGKTRLVYPAFPLRPGQRSDLEIQLPSSLRHVTGGMATLRCLKEYYETSGSGKNRSQRLVHDILYEDPQSISAEDLNRTPGAVHVELDLPEDAPTTQIQGNPTHFWELELELNVKGLDLKQRYLIPVYG